MQSKQQKQDGGQEVSNFQQNLVNYEFLLKVMIDEKKNGRVSGSIIDQIKEGSGGNFVQQFLLECQRVNHFAFSVSDNLWQNLVQLAECLPSLEDGFVSQELLSQIPNFINLCDNTGEELVQLDAYLNTNVKLCSKLLQFIDHGNMQDDPDKSYTQVVSQLITSDFSLEPILVGLSDTYVHLNKLVRAGTQNEEEQWVAPDKFQRQVTKFWVDQENIMKFKTLVIKHLPILIYGDRAKLQFGRANKAVRQLGEEKICDSAQISSVYVDNEDLYTYHQRLVREDGATLARIRWYGERDLGPFQKLYAERKLHREFWTGEFSMKERAPLKQANIQAFMSGSPAVPEMHDRSDIAQTDLLREVQDFIIDHNQKSMIRTQYFRTAFQHPTDNLVRVSLDCDVQMIRELNAPKLPGDWCRNTVTAPVPPHDLIKFPYGIVEVKLQDAAPDWVRTLISSGLLVPVPKFSKFLHGMAMLFGDKVHSTPYWFLPDPCNSEYVTPATIQEMADTYDPHANKGASWLFPKMPEDAFAIGNPPEVLEVDAHNFREIPRQSQLESKQARAEFTQPVSSPFEKQTKDENSWTIEMGEIQEKDVPKNPNNLPNSVRKGQLLIRTRVEPKVFFANERTFLSWMSVAVLLMFVALSLMDSYRFDSGGFGVGTGRDSSTRCEENNSLRCSVGLISGAIIAPMSIMIMGYALFVYRKRTNQMLKRDTVRYDDQLGPLLLAFILISVMMLAYTLSLVVAF
eukprot:TRINITY_DN823_c0_g1_i10.p1 TRINITY_DN823_c0_g1~~TRINITY_DN823_c0_g1_i10.p1  ORF type:complete len:741 (+),score=111.50 TRINITY_DN823_c0_g1_i10:170-2392(+)